MKRRLPPSLRLLAFPAALALAAAAGAALACSCPPPASAAAQLEDADLMIVARVAEVRRLPAKDGYAMAQTRFTVSRTLKGEIRRDWWIRHARDSPMCGVQFRPGQDYAVIAHRVEGRMVTGLCSHAWFPLEDYERAATAAVAG